MARGLAEPHDLHRRVFDAFAGNKTEIVEGRTPE